MLIVVAALLWSTGGAAVKLSALSAPQIAGGRALFAGLVLLSLLPAARRGFRWEVLAAGAFHAVNCVLFVYANQQTTAGNVIFIQNIAPVWILLLAPRLTGDRTTRAELWSVPVSLLGCTLLFFDTPDFGQLTGNLAALAASVLFALLILSYRRLSPDEGIAAVTAGNFMIAIGCLPWAIAGPSPTVADGLVIAYLGVFQQACGHLLFIWGMSAVSALEGALLILIEPIASPGWAYLTVQERPGPWFALGASIVILAQIGRIVSSQRSSGAEKTTPSDDTDGLNGMND